MNRKVVFGLRQKTHQKTARIGRIIMYINQL